MLKVMSVANPKLRAAPGDVIWTRDQGDRSAWIERVAAWARANRTRVTFADVDAERERRSALRRDWRAAHRDAERAEPAEVGRGVQIADNAFAEPAAGGSPFDIAHSESFYLASELENGGGR